MLSLLDQGQGPSLETLDVIHQTRHSGRVFHRNIKTRLGQ